MTSNDVALIDRQLCNPSPMVYDIFLPSSRSLLKFNGEQLHEINIFIYNQSIQILFQFFKENNFFSPNAKYEITANEINYGIIIKGEHMSNIFKYNFLNLVYYQINDDIIINNKFIDWYGIKKNIKTFTQRDDNIRTSIHQTLITELPEENNQIMFIGGEMYVYAKILKYIKGIAFTDFAGIKKDTEINNDIFTCLIDYDKDNIIHLIDDNQINPNVCIVNVLNGLTANLAQQINLLNINKLMIISCKLKTIKSDSNLIKMNLYKTYNFKTPLQHIILSIYIK